MPRCCQGATCSCAIEAGPRIIVTGTGSASDPYVIEADFDVAGVTNGFFEVSVSGAGTIASPWEFEVLYDPNLTLMDHPDVGGTPPTNGQVLAYNTANTRWEPAAPTTAASGSVNTDNSLDGDGSIGTPLGVTEEPDGYLETVATGLGLTTEGKNRLVQHYVNSAARGTGTTPDLNTLTMLDTAPGRLDYWDGVAWVELLEVARDAGSGEFLQLSGGYTGGPIVQMFRQISVTTDVSGLFDMLTVGDLTGYAGVLSLTFQPTGSPGFACNAVGAVNKVQGQAYKLTDGTVYPSQGISGVVTAWLY